MFESVLFTEQYKPPSVKMKRCENMSVKMKRCFKNLLFDPTRYTEFTHECSLNMGTKNLLQVELKPGSSCNWLKRQLVLSPSHPDSADYFSSLPAMLAEQQRQIYEAGVFVIHPLSQFSLYWTSLMVLVNLLHMTLAPFRLMYLLDQDEVLQPWAVDYVLLALQILCMLDVIVQLNSGFAAKRSHFVLDRKRIVLRYVCTWFVIDVASSVPLSLILLMLGASDRYRLIAQGLACLRCFRILTYISNFRLIMKMLSASTVWFYGLRHLILLVVVMHWCCCVMYICPVMHYYWYGHSHAHYSVSLRLIHGELLELGAMERYTFALYLTVSAFCGTGYDMFQSYSNDEVVVNAMIILFASLFTVYTTALMLKLYMSTFSGTMRYYELMNQVENYMHQKLFSEQLKQRVRDFYDYRYEGRYFKEKTTLACLSGELRNEIKLHSRQRFIENVSLFENIPPSVVGAILGCLHAEVYMPNDVIIFGGDVGDNVFFINSGAVAVYSLKGVEIYHQYDGDTFGMLSALMKDHKRVATIIAIEITSLYRMSEADFRRYVMSNPTLAERVEKLVTQLLHDLVVVEGTDRSSVVYPSPPAVPPPATAYHSSIDSTSSVGRL